MSKWIEDNYENIVQWSKNITKSDELSQDLAHYSIETFLTHKKYKEITDKDLLDPDFGHCRGFILAIMRNSWFGTKSEFTRYYKVHRADIGHRKRNLTDEKFAEKLESREVYEYNHEKDFMIEAIEGILEEMSIDTKIQWFNAKIFKLWLTTPNYSKISRETDIPRTTISNAVEAAKVYIREELKKRNINYDL